MRCEKPIHRVITEVLRNSENALTPEEIFKKIQDGGLYPFKAQDPVHVVANDLRRHCIDLNFPSARSTKYFQREATGERVRYRLLARPVQVEPNVYKVKRPGARGETIVTVAPEDHEASETLSPQDTVHTEIQCRLLDLGTAMGFSTWAPKPDRSKQWKGRCVGDVKSLVKSLPGQLGDAPMKIISYIDVIWLQNESIVAAFEVEHTTPVYSGLLRMSDLMCMVPNLRIDWYLVAPESRFEKFAKEVSRPTFCNLRTPLHRCCRFLSYAKLTERLDRAKDLLPHLKVGFLYDIAEQYDPKEAFAD